MAGNSLGPRATYRYFSDSGLQGIYTTDKDHGTAIGAVEAGGSDPSVTLYRLTKRYVLCENADGTKRRKVVVPTPDNTAFLTGGILTIDGEQFLITGRVGEKQTFGKRGGAGGAGGGGTGGGGG